MASAVEAACVEHDDGSRRALQSPQQIWSNVLEKQVIGHLEREIGRRVLDEAVLPELGHLHREPALGMGLVDVLERAREPVHVGQERIDLER